MSVIQYYGTGKRKSSIARVFLRSGKGDLTLYVNKRPRPFQEYFRLDNRKIIRDTRYVLVDRHRSMARAESRVPAAAEGRARDLVQPAIRGSLPPQRPLNLRESLGL